jgi:murein DD-endopeptidase MepM/ murein hydrolase activator NlpD
LLPPPTTTPPPEPPPEQPEEDTEPAEVPTDEVQVPEAEGPPPEDPLGPYLEEVSRIQGELVQKALLQAQESRALVAIQVETLTARIAVLEGQLLDLAVREKAAVKRYQRARAVLKRRAVASYMGGPVSPLNEVLEATDFGDLTRRLELLGAVVSADARRTDAYDKARRAVSSKLKAVVTQLDEAKAGLEVAGALLQGAQDELVAREIQASVANAGASLAAAGFRFPVAGPHSYTDTFGAPRMFGTAYAHLHQGADIFAASGTALVACERGVLIKVGTDVLGGTKLWLVGTTGTRYYYAHLSGYAEGVVEGKVVELGEVIGFVGNTGNAVGTPSHLHFQVHPGGGPPINPTPLLRLVDDATDTYHARAQ